MVSGSYTPNFCKTELSSPNNSTATATSKWTTALADAEKNLKTKETCNEEHIKDLCTAMGLTGNVDCGWMCAYRSKMFQLQTSCTADMDCTIDRATGATTPTGIKMLACESMTAVYTAYCTSDAAKIKATNSRLRARQCARTRRTVASSSRARLPPPSPPQHPLPAASAVSPMWALALVTACLASAVPAARPTCKQLLRWRPRSTSLVERRRTTVQGSDGVSVYKVIRAK